MAFSLFLSLKGRKDRIAVEWTFFYIFSSYRWAQRPVLEMAHPQIVKGPHYSAFRAAPLWKTVSIKCAPFRASVESFSKSAKTEYVVAVLNLPRACTSAAQQRKVTFLWLRSIYGIASRGLARLLHNIKLIRLLNVYLLLFLFPLQKQTPVERTGYVESGLRVTRRLYVTNYADVHARTGYKMRAPSK